MGILDCLLNFFFPPLCVSCKREGDFLCKNCVQELQIKPIRAKSTCPSSQDFDYLDGVIYGLDYAENPAIQSAVAQFKYKFTRQLGDHFVGLLAAKLRELKMLQRKKVVLIPVPLHKKRLNYRGFNQAELIAQGVVENLGESASLMYPLRRVRHTSQQARLNKKERHENLAEAFEMVENVWDFSDSVCFLVDDVCTTGATLDSCARVLKQAGLKKVYGLVVARAFK